MDGPDLPARRPLLTVACIGILGLRLGITSTAHMGIPFALLAIVMCLLLVLRPRPLAASVSVLAAVFLCAWIHGQVDQLNASTPPGESAVGRMLDWCGRWRAETQREGARRLSVGVEDFPDQVALVRAMVLGERYVMPSGSRDLFVSTGTFHIFAISGLHVGMVATLAGVVVAAAGIPRTRWALIVVPLVCVYTIATGARASAVRACIMATVIFLAPSLRRRADGLSALAFAAVVILMAAPSQVLNAGFVFSFTVVAGLIILYPAINSRLGAWLEDDPLRVQVEAAPRHAVRSAGRRLVSLVAASLTAWLVSVPLGAYFFGELFPLAAFANLLVVPSGFLVVLSSSLSLVLGSFSSAFADIFNHANLALIWLLSTGVKAIAGVPCSRLTVDIPSRWWIAAWYVLLLAWARVARGSGSSSVAFRLKRAVDRQYSL